MPRESDRSRLLRSLKQTSHDLTIARYMELVEFMVDELLVDEEEDSSEISDTASGHSGSDISIRTASPAWPESPTSSVTSASSINSLVSLSTAYSSVLSHDIPDMCERVFTQFVDAIGALHDEVEKCRVLTVRPRLSRAPQLHLLEEWALFSTDKFRRKLRVDADIFAELTKLIQGHPIFHNNSNNPQLPVAVQLAVFLNGVGHYGNAATTEDISDWAGVSVGTVYNCYKRVMIALLQLHDRAIHFDPLDHEDQVERERAKAYVERKTCHEWRGGFLCVDGTPSPLHEKPGWHGEGFFDKNSDYSLTAQVVIFPHNLRIVDYVIGVPGSLHDSNVFARTRVSRNPESFFGAGEWLWADSAYAARTWCVPPYKRPPGGSLTPDQKIFNTNLSTVRVRSEHFFGSIKGRFQSLRELRIPIQSQKDLDYANMWIRSCFVLHNLIVEIEEKLNHENSNVRFYEEPRRPRQTGADADAGEDDQREGGGAVGDQTYIGSVGQDFRNTLKTRLLSSLAQRN